MNSIWAHLLFLLFAVFSVVAHPPLPTAGLATITVTNATSVMPYHTAIKDDPTASAARARHSKPPTDDQHDELLDDLTFEYDPVAPRQDYNWDPCLTDPKEYECTEEKGVRSPYATCEQGFLPLLAKKSNQRYTICCNETKYARGTKYDGGGFGCCATTYEIDCDFPHDTATCVSDDKHKIEEDEVGGVKVCKGDAEFSAVQMMRGLSLMLMLWGVCIGVIMAFDS